MKLDAMVKYGAKYFVRLLVLGAIILLFVVILALVAGILIAVTAPLNNSVVTAIVVAAVIAISVVAALYFFIPFILSPYAVVCDETGAIDALKKGIDVGRKPFVKVFALLALVISLVLLALGVGFFVGLAMGLISALLPVGVSRILMLVVSSAVNSYLGIIATASFMAFYLAKKAVVAKSAVI
jgi:MFS family permease